MSGLRQYGYSDWRSGLLISGCEQSICEWERVRTFRSLTLPEGCSAFPGRSPNSGTILLPYGKVLYAATRFAQLPSAVEPHVSPTVTVTGLRLLPLRITAHMLFSSTC